MNKRKFIIDAILNISSSAIPLVTLQLIVFPLIARHMGEDAYGLFLTMIGVVTIVSAALGGALNNTRLLLNFEYEKRQKSGDFPLFLWVCVGIGVAVSFVYAFQHTEKMSLVNVFLFSLIPLLNIQTYYYSVAFRLQINYKRIFINSIVETAGYFLGLWLLIITGNWQYIYIGGFGLSLLYILTRNPLLEEPLRRTALFPKTFYQMVVLVSSTFLSNALTYIDRLLLYPILGGESVSIYYVSTVIGKMIPLTIGPIAGVMLTYFAKMAQIKRRTIVYILLLSSAVGVLGCFFCIWISPMLLTFLYPAIAQNALKYVYITTITALLHMICIVLNPVVLSFHNINWQIAINGINLLVYSALSLLLLNAYGLTGFCMGGLLSMVIRLVFTVAICFSKKQIAKQIS